MHKKRRKGQGKGRDSSEEKRSRIERGKLMHELPLKRGQ